MSFLGGSLLTSCTPLPSPAGGCSWLALPTALVDTAYMSPVAEVWWGMVTVWAGAAYKTFSSYWSLLIVTSFVSSPNVWVPPVPVGLCECMFPYNTYVHMYELLDTVIIVC